LRKLFILIFIAFSFLNINGKVNTDSLKTALKNAEGNEKIDILNILTEANMYKNSEAALKFVLQAKELVEQSNYPEGLIKVYHNLGNVYYMLDNYQNAINFYQKALKLYSEKNDKIGIATCLNNIGDVYNYMGENEKALEYMQKSLKLKKEFGSGKKTLARTLNNIGAIYNKLGKYETAFDYLRQALAIRQKMGDKKRTAFTLNEMGNVYQSIADYDKSLKYYLQALKIEEEIGYKRGMAIALNNIGNVYNDLNNYEKALEYFHKSLKIQQELNFKSGIAFSLTTIGSVYSSQKDYEKALEYYRKALLIHQETQNQNKIALTLSSIGSVYNQMGEYELALAHAQNALIIQKENGDKKGLSTSYDLVGDIFYNLGEYNKALKYDLKSLNLAREMNMRRILAERYKKISRSYYRLNRFKNAYDYYDLYSSLKDSLYSDESSKKIAEMQIKYETEKKEKEIELLKKEKDKTRLITKYLILISALILILLILLYYLYVLKIREIKQRKQNEEEIREMNRTLEKRVQEELEKHKKQQTLLIQKSKLESLGILSAGIAHEINQPVTHLSLGIDNILIRKNMNKLDDTYLENKCNELFDDIDRIRNIIEHIRTFSRDQSSSDLEKLNVNEVIKNTLNLIQTQYKNHNVSIKLDFAEQIGFTIGNKFKLEQVILNMLSNAKDALEEKFNNLQNSEEEKIIKIITYSEKNRITIEIEDNGPGIPVELQEKIFDPFFTTKSIDRGTGLGLSISYGIIREMKGEISVESEFGKFTKMIISLPKI